jgi:hypothetical protein
MKQEFNIGDRVKVSKENHHNDYRNGTEGTLIGMDLHCSTAKFHIEYDKSEPTNTKYGNTESWVTEIEPIKPLTKVEIKQREKDRMNSLIRYQIYADGYNNWSSDRYLTQKEAEEAVSKLSDNPSWSGNFFILELKPITKIKVEKVLQRETISL